MKEEIKQYEKQIENLRKKQRNLSIQARHVAEKISDCNAQIDMLKRENLVNSYQLMIGKYYSLIRESESFKSHLYFHIKDVVVDENIYLKGDSIEWFTWNGEITSFGYNADMCLPKSIPIEDFIETSYDKFYAFSNFFNSIQ